MILAAGYATRLYPLTINTPKALLDVGGKTILGRILAKLFSVDICDTAYIVSNEKFYRNFKVWVEKMQGEGLFGGKKVEVISDRTTSNETRLGAIGDIDFAIDTFNIKDDLIILGSDNLFELDLRDFVQFALSKRPSACLALYDIGDRKKAHLYGIAELKNGGNEIINFEEKPEKPKSTLAATCIYFYHKEKIPFVRTYMKAGLPKDAPGNLIKWFSAKEKVFGYVFKKKWYDIGDIESLKKASEEYRIKGI